jgi:hypothetical protein
VVESSEDVNIVANTTHGVALDCGEIKPIHFNLTPLQAMRVEQTLLTRILLLRNIIKLLLFLLCYFQLHFRLHESSDSYPPTKPHPQ